MVKDPDTGKRLSRPNPRDEWQSIDVPQLRIVEQSVWEQAHALKTEKSHLASHVKRRAPHLLSGLLRCGYCGSGMSIRDRDKTGKARIRCSAIRESGSCSNRRIIYLRDIETVNTLADAMAGHAGAEDDRGSLIADFRALVHSVIVHPRGPWEGFEIEVKGKLAALVGGELFPQARYNQAHYNSGSRVVAGERYHFSPHQPNLRYLIQSFA
jgi:hypothetical protein